MRRLLIGLTALWLLSLPLVACGGGGSQPTQPESGAAPAQSAGEATRRLAEGE
jgi:hypothetical protein